MFSYWWVRMGQALEERTEICYHDGLSESELAKIRNHIQSFAKGTINSIVDGGDKKLLVIEIQPNGVYKIQYKEDKLKSIVK